MIIQIKQVYKESPNRYPSIFEKRESWEVFVTAGVKAQLDAWATEKSIELVLWEPDENDNDVERATKARKTADVLYYMEWRKKHAAIFITSTDGKLQRAFCQSLSESYYRSGKLDRQRKAARRSRRKLAEQLNPAVVA